MGTTFWNFHVRHTDPGEVGAAIALAGGAPFFISATPADGWLSVYPKSMSLTRKLALAVSRDLDALSLFLEVYDSDACQIVLYNKGKRVSAFANEAEEHTADPGDASRFARYANGKDAAKIREILDGKPVFAEDTAIRFAEQLGLARDRVVVDYRWFPPDERPPWLLSVE